MFILQVTHVLLWFLSDIPDAKGILIDPMTLATKISISESIGKRDIKLRELISVENDIDVYFVRVDIIVTDIGILNGGHIVVLAYAVHMDTVGLHLRDRGH